MGYKIIDLGLVDFKKAEIFQREIFKQVKDGLLEGAFILCRHRPIITLGRLASAKNILVPEEELNRRGIELLDIERGGDVTYHGPGQLILYPILDLNYLKKDLHLFLRNLEGLAIELLDDLGISANRKKGLTGVWVRDKKIASIGITVKNWITYHGMAINVKKSDIPNFYLIRPCGMDIIMTSMEEVLGQRIEIDQVKERLIRSLKRW